MSFFANRGALTVKPQKSVVGEIFDIQLTYTAGEAIPAGSTIFFEWGGGWLLTPNLQDQHKPGFTEVKRSSDETLEAELTGYYYSDRLNGVARAISVQVEGKGLAHGEKIEAIISKPHVPFRYRMSTTPFSGDFQFFVKVQVGNKSEYLETDCALRMIAGPPKKLRAVLPAVAGVGDAVPLVVQALDNWNNISETYTGVVQISSPDNDGQLAIDFNVDSKGKAVININFPREGIHYLAVKDIERNWEVESNPILIQSPNMGKGIFLGDLHAHLNPVLCSPKNLDQFYNYAKNVSVLDFSALLRFAKETDGKKWDEVKQINRKHTQSGDFVAFLGFEWQRDFSKCTNENCVCGKLRDLHSGDMNVYYLEDDGPLYKAIEPKTCTPGRLADALKGVNAIAVPHHPSAPWSPDDKSMEHKYVNWELIPKNENAIPLVEIYSKWGCSEYEGNPRPIANNSKGHFVQDALRMGFKLGLIASSDSQVGLPGGNVKEGASLIRYPRGGFACVFAKEKTKAAIFDGLRNRRCYATTGVRMIVDFTLNGKPMGSELKLEPEEPRRIQVLVAGTSIIESITIVRNGENLRTHVGKDKIEKLDFVDEENLNKSLLTAEGVNPFVYYYVRIIQDDWEMGWSSPIWISPETCGV